MVEAKDNRINKTQNAYLNNKFHTNFQHIAPGMPRRVRLIVSNLE